ncbi:tyrosine-protein phosphatase [Sphaerisporangium krabiense]|uniref:Protein tyrosine/serine phosphatase n=1 Tax=Sphaerisporangium krabiense TaxID=763782 RepID=A0A7W9DT69_9ACTN|nr:tyrosine-protein phosphatase [Sphaerisporangium krabiense]MBB5630308.1 protein tyrosine/serine phosphatase [Sphaerisporangium krabiense]
MSEVTRWIALDGAVNVRDLGGLPTMDGRTTRFGRVLRSDNLQDLTDADVRRLVGEIKLRDVIDLRSNNEVALEGPGPLTRVPGVGIHHLTLFAEGGLYTDVEADTGVPAPAGRRIDADRVLPWQGRHEEGTRESRVIGFYQGYLRDRPDAVVAALRVLSRGDGAALVHCAAGKDRTGVVCALALSVAGVTREAIVADYAQTGDRMERILARLRSTATYRDDLDNRPADSHMPRREHMEHFLGLLDQRYDGPLGWLERNGWTSGDAGALRARLLG